MATKEEKAARLREAREKAGFVTAAAAIRRFRWVEATYRSHDNGTRGFNPDDARTYGKAFKVKPGWLLCMEGVDAAPPSFTGTDARLVVNAAVEAGSWNATTAWDDHRQFYIEGLPSPVPDAQRYGLMVQGHSMNEFYEPGTVLDCISIFKNGVRPSSGDHVIVEHERPDGLRELTVKEFQEDDGRYFLKPRSTYDEHQTKIEVGMPEEGHIGDDRVQVVAYVVASYPPRVLDLFRRMGLIKKHG